MDHAEASSLLGAYALHACSGEELEAIGDHLDLCGTCRDEAGMLQEVTGWLAADDVPIPPADLRAAVFDAALGRAPPNGGPGGPGSAH